MIGGFSIGAASIGSVPQAVSQGNFGVVFGGDTADAVVYGMDTGGNGIVFGTPGTATTGNVVFGTDMADEQGIVVGGDSADGVVFGGDERTG